MKRYILIIAIFSIVAVLSLYLYYQQIKPEDVFNVSDFPMKIGQWSAEDIPIEEEVYAILETRNLLLREYKKANSPPIVLYIIYSDKNRKATHPPEVCLTGSGITILEKKEKDLKITADNQKLNIKVNYMLSEQGKTREVFIYWFKAGKTFTPKYLNQQLRIMLNQLKGKSSGGAMIRLSTRIVENEQEAMDRLTSFTKEIVPIIIKTIP